MSVKDALDYDQGGLLSEATLAALNLRHQPFTSELRDASDLADEPEAGAAPFSDAVTEEQLADIKQALITGDDLLLILGDDGAGKSTLLQQLNDNSGLRIQCFSVKGSERFSTTNLFAGMLDAFKRQPPDKLKDMLDELIPCLQSMVGRNTLSTIVLDDAHLADQNELTQLLSAMLYVNSQDETLLRIALSATPEFENSIPDLLPEGADLPYSSLTIEGLIPSRAAAYLDYRLQLAGFEQEFPFTERDMASLVDHSAGRPRELHVLTADVLNEKYGRLEYIAPRDIAAAGEGSGFLQSRHGKLALGALATALIIGGLLFFVPATEQAPDNGTTDDNVAQLDDDTAQQPTAAETTNSISENSQNENVSEVLAQALENNAGSDDQTEASDSLLPDSLTEAADLAELGNDPAAPAQTEGALADNLAASTTSDSGPTEEAAGNVDTGTLQTSDAAGADTGADNTGDTETPETQTQPSELQVAESGENDASAPADNQALASDAQTTASQAPEQQVSESPDNLPIVESQPLEQEPAKEQTTIAAAPANQDSSVGSNIDPQLAGLLESPSWILVQDESLYTVQMTASRDLDSVQNFLRNNPLPAPNSIFSFERNGEIWFALVHGTFSGLSDARLAVERMPAAARRDQPWIRSIARVKEILRQP